MEGRHADRFRLTIGLGCGLLFGFFLLKTLALADYHPAFVFVAPLLGLACLGVALRPVWVVTALLFGRVLLDPFLKAAEGGPGFGLGAVFNLAVILMTLFLLPRNASALFKKPFFRYWTFFLAICVLCVAYPSFSMTGAKTLVTWVAYLCMGLLPWLLSPQRNDKKMWVKALLATTVLPVLFADIDFLRGGLYFDDAGARVTGTFAHPNILGFYLLWLVAFLLYIWKSKLFRLSGWAKCAILLYGANILVILVATKTRNAWFGVWLLFFIFGLLKERRWLVYCPLLLCAAFLTPQIAERLENLSSYSVHRPSSLAWRLEVWKYMWTPIREQWLFGHGVASFVTLSQGLIPLARQQGIYAHNVYMQLLFETGLAGFVCYGMVYWHVARAFYQSYKLPNQRISQEHAVLLAYVFVYLLTGLGDNLLNYSALNWYCWFLWGVTLKALQFQRRAVPVPAAQPIRPAYPRPELLLN